MLDQDEVISLYNQCVQKIDRSLRRTLGRERMEQLQWQPIETLALSHLGYRLGLDNVDPKLAPSFCVEQVKRRMSNVFSDADKDSVVMAVARIVDTLVAETLKVGFEPAPHIPSSVERARQIIEAKRHPATTRPAAILNVLENIRPDENDAGELVFSRSHFDLEKDASGVVVGLYNRLLAPLQAHIEFHKGKPEVRGNDGLPVEGVTLRIHQPPAGPTPPTHHCTLTLSPQKFMRVAAHFRKNIKAELPKEYHADWQAIWDEARGKAEPAAAR